MRRAWMCTAGLVGLLAAGCSMIDEREIGVKEPPPSRTGALAAEAALPEEPAPAPEKLPIPQKKPRMVAGLPVSHPEQLIGLDSGRIVALLGPPAAQAEVSPAQVWTYNGKACVLQLFFYPEINTKEFRALTYEMPTGGETEAAREKCLREVLQSHASS